MSVVIVINPISGTGGSRRGERRLALASSLLAASGEAGDVVLTEARGHGGELARAAVTRGARLVIAWGGDGTINEVAAELLGSPSALGIVRSGSGNSLARELGVARRPEVAIRQALSAVPRSIDAGEIDGRPFFAVAGIGFDEHIASLLDREQGRRRGFTAYMRLALRELWRYRPSPMVVDGEPLARAMLIAAANSSQFGNGATIAPGARLDDGRLDLVMFDERTRLATLLAMPRLFTGGLEGVRGMRRREIKKVGIESDRPIAFHADGEPGRGGTRVEIRVRPAALRVAVR